MDGLEKAAGELKYLAGRHRDQAQAYWENSNLPCEYTIADLEVARAGAFDAASVLLEQLGEEAGKAARINGVIRDSGKACRRRVRVNPVERVYSPAGGKPYVKYSCPVCEAVGNSRISIPAGTDSCPLCGVRLNWDRELQAGDEVLAGENRIWGVLMEVWKDKSKKPYGGVVETETGACSFRVTEMTLLEGRE